MRVNGYEVGQEPTSQEIMTYWKVQHFLRKEWVAGWLEWHEELFKNEHLSQEDFELLVARFERLDFSDEEDRALGFEYEELVEERS